jgi:amino acid transporter/nucleotide-binding universal stress UspA family protein
MSAIHSKRPRNVDARRAAAILYGDWGTSKAYVIGLAFAVAGYSSFWLIAAMCVLTALVGFNYIFICRHYPDGGGVYSSVRHRSEIISIVGAFLLIADYIVTAAISALSAFQYLGVPHPEKFAAIAILVIGAINWFGPRHTGSVAFTIAVPAVAVVCLLGVFSLPHLGAAFHNLQPLHGNIRENWYGFVGIVLALSGVEAIANSTGVMKLNPGATEDRPQVTHVSTRAIVWVMLEVCVFTALLGLAMHALPGLQIDKAAGDASGAQVNAPGHPGVRDYMLRYLGEVFVGGALGPTLGHLFGFTVSIVFALLLFSAVNTALCDLIAIQFLLSRDGESPRVMQRLNGFGVPVVPVFVCAIIPALLVIAVNDMSGLADLYAVGVVGAITVNLGSTATDFKLVLKRWERGLMFGTFLVMAAIELTLFVAKPQARVFAATVLAAGLVLRGIAKEWERKRRPATARPGAEAPVATESTDFTPAGTEPMLCAIRGIGRTLDFALAEAKQTGRPLYLLFVREQSLVPHADCKRQWRDDAEAARIFSYAKERASDQLVRFCYAVSESPADTIADIAATLGVSRLVLGAPARGALINMLRGNIVTQVSRILPEEIHLLVHA